MVQTIFSNDDVEKGTLRSGLVQTRLKRCRSLIHFCKKMFLNNVFLIHYILGYILPTSLFEMYLKRYGDRENCSERNQVCLFHVSLVEFRFNRRSKDSCNKDLRLITSDTRIMMYVDSIRNDKDYLSTSVWLLSWRIINFEKHLFL